MFDYVIKNNFYNGMDYKMYYDDVLTKCFRHYQNEKNLEPGMTKYNKEALLILNDILLKLDYLKVKCVLIIDKLSRDETAGDYEADKENIALARIVSNLKESLLEQRKFISATKYKIVKKTMINAKILKLVQIQTKFWNDRLLKVNSLLNSEYIGYTDLIIYQKHIGRDILEEITELGIDSAYECVEGDKKEFKIVEEYKNYKSKIDNYLKTVEEDNTEKIHKKEEFKEYRERKRVEIKKEKEEKQVQKERAQMMLNKDRLLVEIKAIKESNYPEYVEIRQKLINKYIKLCQSKNTLMSNDFYVVVRIPENGINKGILTFISNKHTSKNSYTSNVERAVLVEEAMMQLIISNYPTHGCMGIDLRELRGFNNAVFDLTNKNVNDTKYKKYANTSEIEDLVSLRKIATNSEYEEELAKTIIQGRNGYEYLVNRHNRITRTYVITDKSEQKVTVIRLTFPRKSSITLDNDVYDKELILVEQSEFYDNNEELTQKLIIREMSGYFANDMVKWKKDINKLTYSGSVTEPNKYKYLALCKLNKQYLENPFIVDDTENIYVAFNYDTNKVELINTEKIKLNGCRNVINGKAIGTVTLERNNIDTFKKEKLFEMSQK